MWTSIIRRVFWLLLCDPCHSLHNTGKNPWISKLDCTWFLLGFPRLSKPGKIAIYPILVHHLDLTVTKSGKLENPDWEIKISKKSSFPHCTWIFRNPNLETQLYNPGLQGSQAWNFSFTGMDFNKPVLDCTINRLGVLSFQERILKSQFWIVT